MSWFHRLLAPKPYATDSRFGYAVVGTGHGAEKMCEALRDSPQVRVAAVLSSDAERGQRFSKRHKLPFAYSYEQFDQLAANPAIQALYLAVPVARHRELTERAAAAGKHVLCEKPMAATAADANAMIAACRAAETQLMIGYRLDYDPMHHEAARLLARHALGDILHVRTNFGIVAKPGWRFDPTLAGGGSLFDVGIYPIHVLHGFFGEIKLTQAHLLTDAQNGLELDARWHGTINSGGTFTCHSSYVERVPDTVEIRGTRGLLTLTHAFGYERTRLSAEFRVPGGQSESLELRDDRHNPSLFRLEAEHLAECALQGIPLRSPGEHALRDLLTVINIETIATRTVRG